MVPTPEAKKSGKREFDVEKAIILSKYSASRALESMPEPDAQRS